VHHNAWTGHFPKLLIHLIRELETAGSAKELPVKAVNTVYFTRLFVKHLVELYSSKEISSHLVMRGDQGTPAGGTTDTKRLLLKKTKLPSMYGLESINNQRDCDAVKTCLPTASLNAVNQRCLSDWQASSCALCTLETFFVVETVRKIKSHSSL
jgi:hypothetical protein